MVLNTYIISIAKYLWLANKKKENRVVSKNEEMLKEEEWVDCPETLLIRKERVHLLQDLLQEMGRNCKDVLMYWANGYKMREIAEIMNYKSENMAKKKYECFKSLLLYVEANPHVKTVLR